MKSKSIIRELVDLPSYLICLIFVYLVFRRLFGIIISFFGCVLVGLGVAAKEKNFYV